MRKFIIRIFTLVALLAVIGAQSLSAQDKARAFVGRQNLDQLRTSRGVADRYSGPGPFLAGAVFAATNHTNLDPVDPAIPGNEVGNQVVMYGRYGDGSLRLIGYFPTGGQGSGPGERFAGDGLGSSRSVQLSDDARWLFVTNACSDTVSVFAVMQDGLELTDVQTTGPGVDPDPVSCSDSQYFPNSVTQYRNIIYVLNSANEGSITGFRLDNSGQLTPIPGSTRGIQANQTFPPDALLNPTQVSFTPDGRQLVVTIKDGIREGVLPTAPTGPGRILVFGVQRDGTPTNTFQRNDLDESLGIPADQLNPGPFGFSFDRRGNLLVALFVGGPDLTGAAGSYRITSGGELIPITPVVAATDQIDLCWLENNGRYAYGANYTSGTISSYEIGWDGSLTLLEPVAAIAIDNEFPAPSNPGARSQGSTPIDLGISYDGRFLYAVLPGSGRVGGWRIRWDGSLISIGEFAGLGQTVEGDQAPAPFLPLESPAGIVVF